MEKRQRIGHCTSFFNTNYRRSDLTGQSRCIESTCGGIVVALYKGTPPNVLV